MHDGCEGSPPFAPRLFQPNVPMKLASPIAVLACTFPLFAAPWSMANAQTAQVDFPAPAQTSYAVEFGGAGGGFAAFNDSLDLVVLAFAPDGAILWQRRVADPIGFPSPSFRPLMVSVPEGGVLVIANDHVVRLGSDGSVLATREMPSDFVAAAAMCRLNDGRILVGKLVPNFFLGFDTPPIPAPNNPGLIGFPLTYGGIAVTASGDILQATLPRSLLLQ